MFLSITGNFSLVAQVKTSILIQSTFEDERIDISINKSVYFPGDTILVVIQRTDTAMTTTITPMLPIEGTTLKFHGRRTYIAVIPQDVTPGTYPINLRVTDSEGRRYRYETDHVIAIEEYQDVEQLSRYVSIYPIEGSADIRTPVTVDRDQIRCLEVQFARDSIRPGMGPQFVRITTTVLLRDGLTAASYDRRMVTFRSQDGPNKDRSLFTQYRTAYGAYANIRPEELNRVIVPVDSLPDWAILGICIEPDYTIKIGAVDRSNSMTRYFRVRGSTIEIGLSLAVPKILLDTQSGDPVEYGNTSAMFRIFFINSITGNRFPISAGIGIFGVSSPVDVGIGRGGFALSMFLDLAEMVRIVNIGFSHKVNIGLELDPFFAIEKKGRLLLVAQAGFSF